MFLNPLNSLKTLNTLHRMIAGPLLGAALATSLTAPGTAQGEAPSREVQVQAARATSAALLKNKDFQGLEHLVSEIKARGYRIDETRTELEEFYAGLLKVPNEEHAIKLRETFAQWLAAFPDSTAARVALADSWIDSAWRARGTGWANTVTEEGWKKMAEYLERAGETLIGKAPETVDDPNYFRLWLMIALGEGWSHSQTNRYFEKGIAVAPEYYPIYNSMAYYLLPKWHGEENDLELFAKTAADRFPGEKGDQLYARLIWMKADETDGNYFAGSVADPDRVKRGFELGLKSAKKSERHLPLNALCRIAMMTGDHATAQRLFFEIGPRYSADYYGWKNTFREQRNRSGAGERIAAARTLEAAGKLDEAEKAYTSLTSDPATNPWLEFFYLKHGMKQKLAAMENPPNFDYNLKGSPDELCEITRTASLTGDWEAARTAADLFDSKRPWNLSGRMIQFLCAAKAGDRARAEELLLTLLNYKSNRPAYQTAQAVLSGETRWEDAAKQLEKCDGFNQQAGLTIAFCYAALGKMDLARKVAETMLTQCEDSPVYFMMFESFLYGFYASQLQ